VRTVPKREAKAFLYAKMTMARGTPILPGQVALFRDGTFVGNAAAAAVTRRGARAGFGVDDAVRVRHAIAEEKRAESGIITSRRPTRAAIASPSRTCTSGPSRSPSSTDPVSQNATSRSSCWARRCRPARHGRQARLVAWEMELKPDEEKVVEFGYRVTWPAAKKITYGQGS